MKTGADILVECLTRWGVRRLFGMPGSHSTTIYDALARAGTIRTYPDPQRAGRRVRRRRLCAGDRASPGVVCTTAGPGATNALTGVAECWADSVPILLLAGQVNSDALDRECGNYHEIDLEGIFRPVTPVVRHAPARRPDPGAGGPGVPGDDLGPAPSGGPVPPAGPDARPLPGVGGDPGVPAAARAGRAGRCDRRGRARSWPMPERPIILAGGGALWSGAAEAIEALAVGSARR